MVSSGYDQPWNKRVQSAGNRDLARFRLTPAKEKIAIKLRRLRDSHTQPGIPSGKARGSVGGRDILSRLIQLNRTVASGAGRNTIRKFITITSSLPRLPQYRRVGLLQVNHAQ
jgi:hypothetical protein